VRRSFFVLAGLSACVAAASIAACSSTGSSAGVPPITGIVVRAETITNARGCGAANNQVFRYAAVVYGYDGQAKNESEVPDHLTVPRTANVFDCFTDGTFVQLSPVNGRLDFRVDVFVYNEPAYQAQKGTVDRATAPEPAPWDPDAGPPPPPPALAVKQSLESSLPTWTTTCFATQLQDVTVLAVCDPLAAGQSGIRGRAPADGGAPTASVVLPLGAFPLVDGGALRCDDQFVKVRARARKSSKVGEPADLRCSKVGPEGTLVPTTFEVNPADAPATYAIDVALFRQDDSLVGQTVCRAVTSPGLTSSAVCDPVK
jgi:hypothetical protein